MLKWIVGGAAVLFLGPPLLRKLADNPDLLRKTADLTEGAHRKGAEYAKRGASAVKSRMNASFAGLMCGDCGRGY